MKMASAILHGFGRFKDQKEACDVVHIEIQEYRPEVQWFTGKTGRKLVCRGETKTGFSFLCFSSISFSLLRFFLESENDGM
jgi:hypothetical protein